jgi:2',3'-cyclic-nucleotide 2'-phosphodiesterase/3'-nucleotidase
MYYFNSKFLFLIIYLSLIICDPINLSEYKYPEKQASDKLIRVPILATNDLHGGIFPNHYHDKNNIRFSNGGGINLYSYVKVLRDQWGDQLLWLDGGDQFIGTMECMLSDCTIMRDYYNKAGLQGIGLGNHDFDYGVDYLRDYIKQQDYPVIVANVKNTKTGKYLYEEWNNTFAYKIYEFNYTTLVKVGVIGLATQTTPSMTSTDVSDFDFEDYLTVTKKWASFLRNEKGVDAVILLTHFGPMCNEDVAAKMKIGMWDPSIYQMGCQENEEIMTFLQQIKDEGIQIDGVVAAHVHDVAHHWISDIPVVESSGPDYFNILYLVFKQNGDGTVTLQNNKIVIEGPVPVCEKLWPDTKNCEYRYEDSSVMGDFIFHNRNVTLDEDLANLLKYWSDIIDSKLNNVLGETKDDMFTDGTKETLLTNFVNDIGKIITESDICFYNIGGIRTTWYRGSIDEIDLFKMFPFNNTWIRFEMTGEEVYHMFQNLAGNTIYPSSGTIQTFSFIKSYYTMKSLLLYDGDEEMPLEPNKSYKICTNDFLANGGSGMGKVRKWYTELRNKKDFGIIRESFLKYMKKMSIITKEKFVDEKYPRITIEN